MALALSFWPEKQQIVGQYQLIGMFLTFISLEPRILRDKQQISRLGGY